MHAVIGPHLSRGLHRSCKALFTIAGLQNQTFCELPPRARQSPSFLQWRRTGQVTVTSRMSSFVAQHLDPATPSIARHTSIPIHWQNPRSTSPFIIIKYSSVEVRLYSYLCLLATLILATIKWIAENQVILFRFACLITLQFHWCLVIYREPKLRFSHLIQNPAHRIQWTICVVDRFPAMLQPLSCIIFQPINDPLWVFWINNNHEQTVRTSLHRKEKTFKLPATEITTVYIVLFPVLILPNACYNVPTHALMYRLHTV